MLHQNDFAINELARYRRQKLAAEAGTNKLRPGHKNGANRRFLEPFLVSFAEILIITGEKLKKRYEPRSAARLSTR